MVTSSSALVCSHQLRSPWFGGHVTYRVNGHARIKVLLCCSHLDSYSESLHPAKSPGQSRNIGKEGFHLHFVCPLTENMHANDLLLWALTYQFEASRIFLFLLRREDVI